MKALSMFFPILVLCLFIIESALAGEYRKHLNAAISGHNVEYLTGVSVKNCVNACSSRSWCKSFDYYKNDAKCDLSNKNRRDVGLKTNYNGNPYDHYYKQ